MATYTMTLADILNLLNDPAGVADNPYVPEAGYTIGLGPGDYPIFDESHRDVLNQKIVARYWTRENGQETISRLKHFMRMRMNERMVFFNQVYLSTLIDFDPLATFNLETIRNGSTVESVARDTKQSSTSNTTGESTSATTTTPQNQLPEDWVHDPDYASGGAASNSETDATTSSDSGETSTDTTNANDTSTTKGFQGSAADLMQKYRAQIVNVDEAIVNMLNDLFMGIYDNGDEMLPPIGFGYGRPLPGFPIVPSIPDLTAAYNKALDK